MTALKDYHGKTALITGAGDGVGAMLARNLAKAGMRVLVQDIREQAANETAREIGEAAQPLVFDVSDREACVEAAEALADKGTRLNMLWINAGVGVGASIVKGKKNATEWAIGVNVLGVIWTAQAFVPLMANATGPRHVGVTSSGSTFTSPAGQWPLYAMSKHGTMAVAEALSGELAQEGIGTTILCPGQLDTEIWDAARARPARYGGERHLGSSVGEPWRSCPKPEAMWPHIEAKIAQGGGYLACISKEHLKSMKADFEQRFHALQNAIVSI